MQKYNKIFTTLLMSLGLMAYHINAIEPTPPSNKIERIEATKQGLENLKGYRKIAQTNSVPTLTSSSNPQDPIDITGTISIVSISAGLLTIWGTAPGNWIFGFGPRDAVGIGSITDWQVITGSDGTLQFKNTITRTCLAGYVNGVIHVECNPNDSHQRWKINHFENGAVQLQNAAYGTCMQTPLFRHTVYYKISLVQCAQPGVQNSDQQWAIIPPQEGSAPLIRLKK